MKIYISHAGNYDYEAELYEPIKRSGLFKHYDFFLPYESHNVDVRIKDIISEVGLLVAEVSSPSTGQGIEIGIADSAGASIICFYRQGTP